jgi:hypothetical protein
LTLHITLTTSHTGAQTCARSVRYKAKAEKKLRDEAKEQARLLAAQSSRGKEKFNPAEGMPSDSEDKDEGKHTAPELHQSEPESTATEPEDNEDPDDPDADDPDADDAAATEGFLADRD